MKRPEYKPTDIQHCHCCQFIEHVNDDGLCSSCHDIYWDEKELAKTDEPRAFEPLWLLLLFLSLIFLTSGCAQSSGGGGEETTEWSANCFGLDGLYTNGPYDPVNPRNYVRIGQDKRYEYCAIWSYRCGDGYIRAYDATTGNAEIYFSLHVRREAECPAQRQWTTLRIVLTGNTLTIDNGTANYQYTKQ